MTKIVRTALVVIWVVTLVVWSHAQQVGDGLAILPKAGGGGDLTATYIIQTADASLANAQVLGSLVTGLLKNTTTTGVLSIATASDLPMTFGSVAFSATPTFDASLHTYYSETLTANVTSSTISNPTSGEVLTLELIQDATGARTFAFPANVVGACTISPTPSQATRQTFRYDGANWNAVAPCTYTDTPFTTFAPTRGAPGTNPASGFIQLFAASTGGANVLEGLDASGNFSVMSRSLGTVNCLAVEGTSVTGAFPGSVGCATGIIYNNNTVSPALTLKTTGSGTSAVYVWGPTQQNAIIVSQGYNGVALGTSNWVNFGSTVDAGGSIDAGLKRNAAGVVEVNSGIGAAYRELKLRSLVVGGTVPGISGCTAGTQTGGATAGTFTSGTTGTCTVTLTFAFTAPTGWNCLANDRTTPADLIGQTTTTTTTCVLSGSTLSGDIIGFTATAY